MTLSYTLHNNFKLLHAYMEAGTYVIMLNKKSHATCIGYAIATAQCTRLHRSS